MIDPNELMRLLVPEGRVKEVAKLTGISSSLLYQERRPAGEAITDTGTRNSIGRLDIICELALSHNPEAVRMLGQRYLDVYASMLGFPPQKGTKEELDRVTAQASQSIGQAIADLVRGADFSTCSISVEKAVLNLQRALKVREMLEENEHVI